MSTKPKPAHETVSLSTVNFVYLGEFVDPKISKIRDHKLAPSYCWLGLLRNISGYCPCNVLQIFFKSSCEWQIIISEIWIWRILRKGKQGANSFSWIRRYVFLSGRIMLSMLSLVTFTWPGSPKVFGRYRTYGTSRIFESILPGSL